MPAAAPKNRRLKLFGFGVLVLMAVAIVWQLGINGAQPVHAQQPNNAKFDRVEARGFTVLSKEGKHIVELAGSTAEAGKSVGQRPRRSPSGARATGRGPIVALRS